MNSNQFETITIVDDVRNIKPWLFPYKYKVLVADPPWPYQQFSDRKQGAARASYNLMAVEEIISIPVQNIVDDNCILLLWGTWPKLPEALLVLHAWGFDYVTGFPWVKLNQHGDGIYYGVGFWVRGCSEFVLIGRKGNVSPPRLEGILGLMSPNIKHSRKPNSIHELGESLPGPYLELFARRTVPGWTCFGNEIETEDGETLRLNGKSISSQLKAF